MPRLPAPPVAAEVATLLSTLPAAERRRLLELRALVYAAAAQAGVGALEESLKWGDPAYRPLAPRTGTTVRINKLRRDPGLGLFFHCHTTLVAGFRELYGETLRCKGNRAILLDASGPLPRAELQHCIALALTYHRRPRR